MLQTHKMNSRLDLTVRPLVAFILFLLVTEVCGRGPSWRHQPRMRVMQKRMEASLKHQVSPRTEEKANTSDSSCFERPPAALTASKTNIWKGLTDDESAAVIEWLFDQDDLNLTISDEAGPWSNVL